MNNRNLAAMPRELINQIFSILPRKNLITCLLLSKEFHNLLLLSLASLLKIDRNVDEDLSKLKKIIIKKLQKLNKQEILKMQQERIQRYKTKGEKIGQCCRYFAGVAECYSIYKLYNVFQAYLNWPDSVINITKLSVKKAEQAYTSCLNRIKKCEKPFFESWYIHSLDPDLRKEKAIDKYEAWCEDNYYSSPKFKKYILSEWCNSHPKKEMMINRFENEMIEKYNIVDQKFTLCRKEQYQKEEECKTVFHDDLNSADGLKTEKHQELDNNFLYFLLAFIMLTIIARYGHKIGKHLGAATAILANKGEDLMNTAHTYFKR